jgi:dTDP-4-dehydrorhamnose 3,5-epimerase
VEIRSVDRIETSLPGVVLIQPRVFEDHRGFFMEWYNQREMAAIGITDRFVQDNHSRSQRGVLRGLHYQLGPPQAKLIRVTRGRVFDVAVDIRRGSPSFAHWIGVELTEDNRRMMFVPGGFAHGFLVLSEAAEVQYKCSAFYSPDDERGLPWDDPGIGIEWPLGELQPQLSERDRAWCTLDSVDDADLPTLER